MPSKSAFAGSNFPDGKLCAAVSGGIYSCRFARAPICDLVTVTPAEAPEGAEKDLLGFETLTLAPIDVTLVEPSLVTGAERAWLDAYHARVREALTPLVDADTARWLETATRQLG